MHYQIQNKYLQEEKKTLFNPKLAQQQVNIYRGELGKHCLTQESITREKEKKTKEKKIMKRRKNSEHKAA